VLTKTIGRAWAKALSSRCSDRITGLDFD